MRRSNLTISAAALFTGILLAFGANSMPVRAEAQVNGNRQGLPGRRISGGSRSPSTQCLKTPDQPVVALMPKSNLGRTLSKQPTFWFSLPAISTDRTLEFGLYDESGELLFKERFSVSGKAEVASLSLPETVAALTVDTDYRWYLSVVCNQESRAEDLVVTGWIRRVQLDDAIQTQLANASDSERIAIYQKLELWHETLAALAQLRKDNPATSPTGSQIEEQWVNLLRSVELPQAIAAPLGNELVLTTPQIAQATSIESEEHL